MTIIYTVIIICIQTFIYSVYTMNLLKFSPISSTSMKIMLVQRSFFFYEFLDKFLLVSLGLMNLCQSNCLRLKIISFFRSDQGLMKVFQSCTGSASLLNQDDEFLANLQFVDQVFQLLLASPNFSVENFCQLDLGLRNFP